jgi:hypothetical protein
MNPDDIKIRDIKPLMEVPDQSFYIFMGVLLLSLIIIAGGSYLFLRWFKTRKRQNLRKSTYQKLLHVDLQDPKRAAYEVTEFGLFFRDDSQRTQEMYDNLVTRLEKYKYKKLVEPIDMETQSYIELYQGMIDV